MIAWLKYWRNKLEMTGINRGQHLADLENRRHTAMDAYDIYCEWAKDHNKPTLTREQWQRWILAIAENQHPEPIIDDREVERKRHWEGDWKL